MSLKDRKYCVGCDQHFYNGNNNLGVKECWSLKSAKVVTRYELGWWVPPTRKENFKKVKTYNCHTETGKVAFYDELPPSLRKGVC